MASLNKVQVIGHVGRDPEVRFTQSGDPVANFSVAATEKWNGKSGPEERTEWFSCVAFGKRAQVVRDYVTKGRQLYVEGKLQTEEWTDKDGAKRKSVKVIASQIILLGSRGEKDDTTQQTHTDAHPEFQVSDDDVPF
jgi:single-strand DNA-binding protein